MNKWPNPRAILVSDVTLAFQTPGMFTIRLHVLQISVAVLGFAGGTPRKVCAVNLHNRQCLQCGKTCYCLLLYWHSESKSDRRHHKLMVVPTSHRGRRTDCTLHHITNKALITIAGEVEVESFKWVLCVFCESNCIFFCSKREIQPTASER